MFSVGGDNIDNQFVDILNSCILVIEKYADISKYPQYSLYNERYNRMSQYTKDLIKAVNNGVLAKDFWSLEISKMLDMNDHEEIKSNILNANQFYCKHYQKI